MLKKISEIRKDELIRGSFILLIMMGFYNLLNYVFQLAMARMLGPADYGVLAVLMSIIYIFCIPSEAIQTIISKYTSKFNTSNNLGKIKNLAYKGLSKGVLFAGLLFLIMIPVSIILSKFLKINFWLFFLTNIFLFLIFSFSVIRGVMQGRKNFIKLGGSLILEATLKVVISIILVALGLSVYGAIGGVVVSSFIAVILSLLMLRDVFKVKKENTSFTGVYIDNFYVLISMIGIVFMYSLDIILARAFFSPEVAGQYAFISLVGKVIFFLSAPIAKTMLPISSEGFEKGEKTQGIFKKSLLLVIAIASAITILYGLFPEFIIRIISLGSEKYLAASHILFTLGIAYSLISITNIIVIYEVSINKIKKSSYVLIVFAIIQVILLSFFNSTLYEFSLAFLASAALMAIYSLFWLRGNH